MMYNLKMTHCLQIKICQSNKHQPLVNFHENKIRLIFLIIYLWLIHHQISQKLVKNLNCQKLQIKKRKRLNHLLKRQDYLVKIKKRKISLTQNNQLHNLYLDHLVKETKFYQIIMQNHLLLLVKDFLANSLVQLRLFNQMQFKLKYHLKVVYLMM